jgi:transketolase
MASWAARCFEQIRYSCAMAQNPITIIGNGVGLGYAPAGPAHEPTEDIAYMRSIEGLEILSPSSDLVTKLLVDDSTVNKKLRWVRLERSLPEISPSPDKDASAKEILEDGMSIIAKNGDDTLNKKKVIIFCSGYVIGKAIELANKLNEEVGISTMVVDLFRIKPLSLSAIEKICVEATTLVSLEEQYLDGGFGSALLEGLNELKLHTGLIRIGLSKSFIFENGTREELLDKFGLNVSEMFEKIIREME